MHVIWKSSGGEMSILGPTLLAIRGPNNPNHRDNTKAARAVQSVIFRSRNNLQLRRAHRKLLSGERASRSGLPSKLWGPHISLTKPKDCAGQGGKLSGQVPWIGQHGGFGSGHGGSPSGQVAWTGQQTSARLKFPLPVWVRRKPKNGLSVSWSRSSFDSSRTPKRHSMARAEDISSAEVAGKTKHNRTRTSALRISKLSLWYSFHFCPNCMANNH